MKRTKGKSFVICTVKLRPTKAQVARMSRWLWHLTGLYNWAIRKIELDAAQGIYWSRNDLNALLNGHGAKLGMPMTVLNGTVGTAHDAWERCYKGLARRPRLRGRRNRLNSIYFRQLYTNPKSRRVSLGDVLGQVRFHRQDIPDGRLKGCRVIKRASGWYAALIIEGSPRAVTAGSGAVGIDPGFSSLLTLSDGVKVKHPRELERAERRIAQAQRGHRDRLTARLCERAGCIRQDRNHKLSRQLVTSYGLIAFSADNHRAIARRFGKSVQSSSHYQLRRMIAYKSRLGGGRFIEVESRNSTRTCSACGALTGPTGLRGLAVRAWVCSACGAQHDRDVNAAVNTLKLGLETSHEGNREVASGIAS